MARDQGRVGEWPGVRVGLAGVVSGQAIVCSQVQLGWRVVRGRFNWGGALSRVGSAGMARGIRDRVGWGVGWSGVGWRR